MKQYFLTTASVFVLAGAFAAAGLVTGTPATAQTTQMEEPEAADEMPSGDAQEMETDDDAQQMGQQRKKHRDRMHKGRYHRDGDRYNQRRMRHHGGRDGMMMGGMMGHGMGHGHMMRMMFIIADADGNGALSLQEVQTIHERIFNAVDADDDGEVTMEEMQSFMSDMKGGSKKGRGDRQQQQQ